MFIVFSIGDNNNSDYEKIVRTEVSDEVAYAIMNTWEDNNEDIYNRFCDNVVPRLVRDLPHGWYFKWLQSDTGN